MIVNENAELEKFFDEKIKELDAIPTNSYETWKIAHTIFGSEEGKKFLELLKNYLMMPVSSVGKSERYACVREGHNEIIRMLLRMQRTNPDTIKKEVNNNGK